MDDAIRRFEKRHKAVTKRHRQMARGYVTKLGRNGVIQHQPRRHLPGVSFSTILLMVTGLLAFKSFLFVSLGAEVYQLRVDALGDGTLIERGGAFLMQADPATLWIAANIAPLLS